MNDAHDRWFSEQILPLESALTRYLRRAWPDATEVDDLRQEVYVRVYDATRERRPPVASYFVFSVAKNLLVDRLRRRRVVSIDLVADLARLDVLSDDVPIDRVLSGREELTRLSRAVATLPPRCREVFRMRKIEGLSQRETAARLGIAQGTVEKQVAKAMSLLTTRFLGSADNQDARHEAQDGPSDEAGSTG
jgi:RNA polymerase sigma-70 factor (ECF subfamily)